MSRVSALVWAYGWSNAWAVERGRGGTAGRGKSKMGGVSSAPSCTGGSGKSENVVGWVVVGPLMRIGLGGEIRRAIPAVVVYLSSAIFSSYDPSVFFRPNGMPSDPMPTLGTGNLPVEVLRICSIGCAKNGATLDRRDTPWDKECLTLGAEKREVTGALECCEAVSDSSVEDGEGMATSPP